MLGHSVHSIKGDLFKGEIEVTLFDFLYGTSLLLLNVYCLYLYVLYGFKRSSSIVLDIGAYFVTNGVLMLAIIAMVLHNVWRHRIWRIFFVVHECDQKLKKMDAPINSRRYFWITLSATVLVFALTGSLLLFSVFVTGTINDEISFIGTTVANTNFITIGTMFMLSVYTIYIRFAALNQIIWKKFLEGKSIAIRDVKPKKSAKEYKMLVYDIRILHDTLTDVVDEINFCFSFQVMCLVALCFVFTLLTTFAGYRVARTFDAIVFSRVLNNAVWSVYYVIFALSIITMCSLATREGNHTSALVHKVINTIGDPEAIEMLRLFSMQLNHRSPIFSCGLFPFDWTLFYSIVSAAATYIVILIQFELSLPTDRSAGNATINQ